MVFFFYLVLKIVLSLCFFLLLALFLFYCLFKILGIFYQELIEASHDDFDDDFLWWEEDFTFAGPFYFDEYYEQWYESNSWAEELIDYFNDDEDEDPEEEEDMQEEYFDKFYLDTLDQTWVWRNKFVSWLLRDPTLHKAKREYDIRFFLKK